MRGAPHPQAQPDRLLAQGHVRINSPQLVGSAGRLEAWFVQAPANAIPAAPGDGRATVSSPAENRGSQPVALPPTSLPGRADAAPLAAAPGLRPASAVPSRYKVEGQRIRVQFAVRGPTTEVENLAVDQEVHLVEIQTATPDDQPLVVAGDQLEVLRANAVDAQVTVSGKPAQAGSRGLEMYGAVIRLDKGANRLWINGPGRMKLPANSVAADGSPGLPGMGMPMSRQAGYDDGDGSTRGEPRGVSPPWRDGNTSLPPGTTLAGMAASPIRRIPPMIRCGSIGGTTWISMA